MNFVVVEVGERVDCRWKDGRFYVAQITKFNATADTYNVYYPEDGERLYGVDKDDIKQPLQISRSRAFSNSSQVLGKTFYDEGSRRSIDCEENFSCGEFIVRKFSSNNNFICERVRFNDEEDVELLEFDIGYVTKRVRAYEEE